MFIKFKRCGHLEYFPPARSAHVRTMDGVCRKCIRKQELARTLVSVEVRRSMFVDLEAMLSKKQTEQHRNRPRKR